MRDRSVLDGSTIGADLQPTPWMTWAILGVIVIAFVVFAGAWGPALLHGPGALAAERTRVDVAPDARFIYQQLLFHASDLTVSKAFWQPLTAMWFHDPVGLGHMLVNLVALLLFGIHYERARGSWRLLSTFVLGNLAAALAAWACLLFVKTESVIVLGCSGGVFALGAAVWRGGAGVFISLLGYGPWAVRRFVPIVLVVVTVLLISQSNTKEYWGVAPFLIGHLAAVGVGCLSITSRAQGLKHMRQRMRPAVEREPEPLSPPETDETRQRVDELLDKIATEGMAALTAEERAFLSDASKRF